MLTTMGLCGVNTIAEIDDNLLAVWGAWKASGIVARRHRVHHDPDAGFTQNGRRGWRVPSDDRPSHRDCECRDFDV